MPELVSILIPAYNSEKWIGDAVKSALNQTWSKKEIVIVDDGSSDHTLSIARRFESRSVKVLTQENRGASAARNKALLLAQGDYIQWIDADDLLHPDKISEQMKNIEPGLYDKVLLSSAWGRFYFRSSKAKFVHSPLWQDLSPVEWFTMKMEWNAWMSIETWLVSRKLAELAGPWDERLSMDDDGEYFGRIVSSSEKVRFVPEAKSYCRRGYLGSLSSDLISDKKMESQFLSICLQINYLRLLEDSERTKAACLKYLERYLIYFYPDKTAILEKANDLAKELGGELSPPALKWRYSIIKQALGWRIAKRSLRLIPTFKMLIVKNWDKLLYNLSI
jgi:glycosyltransferase involved in cell wall biosynthesis